jgi:hypothetical protein
MAHSGTKSPAIGIRDELRHRRVVPVAVLRDHGPGIAGIVDHGGPRMRRTSR